MRILVAGGAGYVGSHVVRALLDAGHDVVVYDNLSTGHAAAVQEAELIVGDIGDRERLEVLLRRGIDGVVHLAASSLVGESMLYPSQYFQNNVVKGLSFFDALVSAGVPWVVFSSTAAVYGDPEQVPIPESHPLIPTNPYGESKRALEQVLRWYHSAYGLRYTALRYFNAAGAHADGRIGEDHTPETHLVPIILQAALGQREAVSVFGSDYETVDGTAVRDYVHVCDLATAHVAAMHRLAAGEAGGAFNLGSERGHSVMEVVEAARRITGRSIYVRTTTRRAGDPPVLVARSTHAHSDLGWSPVYELDHIIDTAWRWHLGHPRGYDGLN